MEKAIYSKEYKEIVLKLIRARHDSRMTQEQAADKLGKPKSYIAKIENVSQRMDIIELKSLANLYGKSLREIIDHILD